MLTWYRTGLLGECGGLSFEKDGESDVENQNLQGDSPYLCLLSTDELATTSKYWMYRSHARYMGPIKQCSMFMNRWLSFIILPWLLEVRETGWHTHGSVNWRAGDCDGSPFFSGAVGFVQLNWISVKGCCVWLVMRAYVSCVSNFSCRMYIDSIRRDSRIGVTAWLVIVST
jgi:hypothetical protein